MHEGKGSFWKNVNDSRWIAEDEHGRGYEVAMLGTTGGPADDEKLVFDEVEFTIRGFTAKNGTKLTLKRTLETHEIRNVDWEVELPAAEHLPWITP